MAFLSNLHCIYISLFLLSLTHSSTSKVVHRLKHKSARVGFTWENCGPPSDPLLIKSLIISPDPILVPGNISAGISAIVTTTLPTDIRIAVTMERKVGTFYVKVPCIDNVGSCTYGGLCEAWAQACPKYFEKYGIPCQCPIPPNTYSIPDIVVDVTSKLPSQLSGEFRITGDIGSSQGHVGCIRLEITLKS